jgi:hypothetical protein
VPDPRLRAALLALKGTACEPAIAGTLDGTYSTVVFGPLNDAPGGTVARVQDAGDGTLQIVFNQMFQYEDFRLLTPVFAHEPPHHDLTVSNKEELIANSIEALDPGEFLLENPGLATSGTELAQSVNTQVMARLNTRDADGNLRLFTSTGNIFPGGDFVPYFAAPFEPLGNDNTGNKILKGELTKVVGKGVKVPKKPNFDDNTALLLDGHEGLLTPEQIVQLAGILKLDTSPPSATGQAQRAQEEATASEQPVPDWRGIFPEE